MKKAILTTTILFALFFLRTSNLFAQTANEPGSGNALSFDGNDYISVVNNSTLNFGTGNFSIEFWINADSSTNLSQIIISTRNDACNDGQYWTISRTAGTLSFVIHTPGTSYFAQVNNIDDGSWHHIVAMRLGTQQRIYKDGILIQTTSITLTNVTNTGPLRIGLSDCSPYLPGGGRYSGQIDEVRIWNRALTQAEIQQNMCKKLPDNYGNGLVGYWRFDEGVDNTCSGGQDVCDASGNGNNGVKF